MPPRVTLARAALWLRVHVWHDADMTGCRSWSADAVRLAALALFAHAALVAQTQTQDPQGTVPRTTMWPGYFGPTNGMVSNDVDAANRRTFGAPNAGISPFTGFPTFPSGVSPSAAFQPPPNWNTAPTVKSMPPSQVPAAPDWPTWLRVREQRTLPYEPSVAVLVRQQDRVWFRAPDEQAFVPLYFFDKIREIRSGTEIQVRQSGEFGMLLHGGSRLVALGAVDLRVAELTDTLVAVELRSFTELRLRCIEREHRFTLPDGSVLVVPPQAADASGVDLQLQRIDVPEPSMGRATVTHESGRAVSLVLPHGTVELVQGTRSTVFFAASPGFVQTAMASQGVAEERSGTARRFRAGAAGGVVRFSGSSFQLPGGATLVVDPLLGDFDRPVDPATSQSQPSKKP